MAENVPGDAETPLPLYHPAGSPPAAGRPLWCAEPACLVLTEKHPDQPGLYCCPRCRKVYPKKDEPVSPETWPEGFPGHRAAERKKAATDAASAQQKFKLKF